MTELGAAAGDFRAALALLEAELAGVDVPSGGAVAPGAPTGPGAGRPGGGAASPVDQTCRALLRVLRQRCPNILPAQDLPAGTVAPPVPVPAETAGRLLVTAMQQGVAAGATGRVPPPDADLPTVALWQEGVDALIAEIGQSKIGITDGEIQVYLPVRCDQLPDGTGMVSLRFVVGTADRPTGLFAATSLPEGPAVVVARWGDALTALAWQAVLDVAHGLASNAGGDADGAGLVPVALVAGDAGLVVLPQARHPIDRVVNA
jgi:hypothetical protein